MFSSANTSVRFRTRLLLALALAFAPVSLRAADALVFDLPAQPLAQALRGFAAQADVSIGLSGADTGSKVSREVRGALSPADALARLLEGSGLSFDMVDAATFRIFATPAAAPSQRAAALPAEEPPPRVEVIVVTAPKRLTPLQIVPFSLVAVTHAPLRHYGVRSADDIPAVVAGLSATNQGPGRNKFFIRGLSDGAFSGNAQSSVATYIDEQRTSFNGPDPNLRLVDIDRVEVVRGPQGALYGAGPISGLVRIVTAAPQLDTLLAEAEAYSGAGPDIGLSGGASAMINAPLVQERAALRVVAYGDHAGGFVSDMRLGKTKANQANTAGMRVQSRVILSDDWSVHTGVTAQWIHAKDTQYFDRSQPRFRRGNYVREPYTNDFLSTNLAAEGDLGWASLLSTTAWSRQDVATRFDASLAVPLLLRAPVAPAAFDEPSTYYTLDHETRLVSAYGGDFDWLAGAFASRSVRHVTTRIAFTQPAETFYFKTRRDTGYELALFGEATYRLDSAWEVTTGLRFYRGLIDVTGENSELDDGPPKAVGQSTGTGFTPKASLSYRLDGDNLLYAQVGQGFRLGGVNVNNRVSPGVPQRNARLTVTNFNSDRLWNFELGSKSELLDGTLRLNAAAYYAIWEHIQADLTRSTGLAFTANLGSVRNTGFDMDLTYVPVRGLEILANISLSNPVLREDQMLAPGTTSRLPQVPKFAGLVAARYQRPVTAETTIYGSGRLEFTGRTNLGQGMGRGIISKPYAVLDAEAGVRRGAWDLSLYVDNLFDCSANTFAFGNPFNFGQLGQATPPRPRTIGLRLGWSRTPARD